MNSRSRAIRLKAALSAVVILASTIAQPDASQARWYDTTTGLYHTNARYYHPRLGRFIQRDPNELALLHATALAYHAANPTVSVSMARELQYGDGMNFYEFVRSNAVNHTDPTGLFVGYQRFVADVTGSAIAAYAFGLDAAITIANSKPCRISTWNSCPVGALIDYGNE